MISADYSRTLERQHYAVVGSHSAAKTCAWCRSSLRGEDACYKEKFYGISSHRCIQMTPALATCNLRCLWCWRAVEFTQAEWEGTADAPAEIVDGCLQAQQKLLSGFGGYAGVDRKKLAEAKKPLHFAISLIGEPTLYPKLPELVREIHSRGLKTFLVTNGTNPEMVKKLLRAKSQPTQFYLTLPAPEEGVFKKSCNPLLPGLWEKIMESLSVVKKFNRSVVRLTLVKGLNMVDPAGYAGLLQGAEPSFIEAKAYMFVGLSRKRLREENMPLHPEIRDFAEKINNNLCGYSLAAESKPSRVVMLWDGKTKQKIDFQADD